LTKHKKQLLEKENFGDDYEKKLNKKIEKHVIEKKNIKNNYLTKTRDVATFNKEGREHVL